MGYEEIEGSVERVREYRRFCEYQLPWVGPCGKPAGSSGYCREHRKQKCRSCGKQATHGCNVASSLVCGMPLCDDCVCPIHEK